MNSWNQFKNTISSEKESLDSKFNSGNVGNKVTEMNAALSRYTSRAGISLNPDTDPDYIRAQEIFQELTTGIREYGEINKKISNELKNITSNADLVNKLKQVGEARQSIIKLESELKNLKQDLDTSSIRQNNIQKPRQEVSWYQGIGAKLGFTRPLYVTTIPFLIGFGLFILFLTGLILRDFFTPATDYANTIPAYNDGGVMALFTNTRFYGVAAGAILVFFIAIILALSGQLGKTLK
jgi:hypothetical protein